MSRFDYPDPGTDPEYGGALQPESEPEPEPTIEEMLDGLNRRIDELLRERASTVSILGAFASAPITMSSLQPVLELAARLSGRTDDGDPTLFPLDSRD